MFSCDSSDDLALIDILKKQDCVEYIQLYSIKKDADEFGESETWVMRNYRIDLWKNPTEDSMVDIINGKSPVSGKLFPGSRALILDKVILKKKYHSFDEIDYKVLSPLDESIGWINSRRVEKTLYQNPLTHKECSWK